MTLEAEDKECAAVAVAPRVPLKSIHDKIGAVAYHHHDTLTICIVTMKNGFHVVGTAACASPENYNMELGNKLAHEDCIRQIWRLEGYLLRENLAMWADTTNAPAPSAA